MKRRASTLALPFAVVLLSCEDSTQPLVPTRLQLTSEITELAMGDSAVVTVIAYAGDKPIEWPVQWASTDTTVVSIAGNGRVQALSEGTAHITARASTAHLMFPIRVVPFLPIDTTRVDSLFRRPALDSTQTVIQGGLGNVCALSGGTAYCWGSNVLARLGVTDSAFGVTRPTALKGNFQFASLALGGNGGNEINCGLTPAGKAVCWGLAYWGTISTEPALVASHLTFSTIAPGMAHVCGIDTSGTVYCWGQNESGELGRPASAPQRDPQPVSLPEKMVAVAAGFRASCALGESGTVYCWGTRGPLLGRGEAQGSLYSTALPAPVQSSRTFARLYGRNDRMCALTMAGLAYCWGEFATTPKLRSTTLRFRSLAIGIEHDCGIATNGLTYCWGRNERGQLGTGNLVSTSDPGLPVSGGYRFRSIAVGGHASCGLLADGITYCWGTRYRGHLGDGYSWERPLTPVKGNITFTQLSAGGTPGGGGTQCGITPDSRAYCWGNVGWVMTGGPVFEPTLIPSALRFRSAHLSGDGACFLDVDGVAWCIVSPNPLRRVEAPHPFVSISFGGGQGCGLTANGDAYCWGSGLATDAQRVATELRFARITTRDGITCAVALQGELYCWGAGYYGRLGTAVTDSVCAGSFGMNPPCTFTPKKITGLPPVQDVAVTSYHVCAITEDGDVYCWGRDAGGPDICVGWQTPSPCQRTPARVNTIPLRSLNRTDYGEITALDAGGNVYGFRSATTPSQPLNLPVRFVSYAGQCGLTIAGQAYCSGSSETGAVGDGILPVSPVPVRVSTTLRFGR